MSHDELKEFFRNLLANNKKRVVLVRCTDLQALMDGYDEEIRQAKAGIKPRRPQNETVH